MREADEHRWIAEPPVGARHALPLQRVSQHNRAVIGGDRVINTSKVPLLLVALVPIAWLAAVGAADATLVAEVTDIDWYTCTIANPRLSQKVVVETAKGKVGLDFGRQRSIQFYFGGYPDRCWVETKAGEKFEGEVKADDVVLTGQFLVGSLPCQYEIALTAVREILLSDTSLPPPSRCREKRFVL